MASTEPLGARVILLELEDFLSCKILRSLIKVELKWNWILLFV